MLHKQEENLSNGEHDLYFIVSEVRTVACCSEISFRETA